MTAPLTNRPSTLLRLRPYPIEKLPSHPQIQSDEADQPELGLFIQTIFDDAEHFIQTLEDGTTWRREKNDKILKFNIPGVNKTQRASVAQYHRSIAVSEPSRSHDFWFARQSKHDSVSEMGTSTMKEFQECLKDNHCDNEVDYTPEIIKSAKSLEYENLEGKTFGYWSNITIEIREIVHKIPLLTNRAFPVAVLTAQRDHSFIVIQLPLFASDPVKNQAVLPITTNPSKVVVGEYISVEQVSVDEASAQIDWRTALASDAKGVLPMSVQKMSVPGVVTKDVGIVLSWIDRHRR